MTVPISDRLSQLYVGNGVNTRFDFTFRVFNQEGETGVGVRQKTDVGFVTIDPSLYNVTIGLENRGGYVDFLTAPATNVFFYIVGATPPDQLLDITNYDNFYPDAIEIALDKLTALLQEWGTNLDQEIIDRIASDNNILEYIINQGNALKADYIARDAVLKNYIDQMIALVTGDPSFTGITANFVIDISGISQQLVNDGLASISALLAIPSPQTGSRQYVNGLQGGWFVYDSSKSATNNGGTIFNGWVRQFSDWVKPEWWGAIPNGTFDCTSALQSAINYCIGNLTMVGGTLGSGCLGIELGKGIYRTTDRLNFTGAIGFKTKGVSTHSTVLFFDASNKSFGKWTTYLDIDLSDFSIYSGTMTPSGNLLQFTATPEGSRTNTAFDFDSTNTGAYFIENRIFYAGFKTVYSSKNSTVNGDNHVHNQCVYLYNDLMWDNTNPNAVIWSFNECKSYHNIDCFKNAGSTMTVNGGDWINKATFFTGNTNNLATDCNFYNMRFEMYQNIDPSTNPKFLDLSANHTLTFTGCTSRGGGDISAKVTATLSGLYDIEFKRCNIRGIFSCNVNSSTSGVTSRLAFNKCDAIPTINQTLNGSQGNRPANIELIGHRISSTGSVNRFYSGGLSSATVPMQDATFYDRAFTEASINNSTTTRLLPVFNLAPYILKVVGFDISFWSNGAQAVVIDIYSDATKVKKLATVTTAVAQNQYQIFEIGYAALLASHDISASGLTNLYAEMSSAANAGTCRVNITTKTRQVN